LRTLFYQLCNFQEAPVTPVFVFDGPGRPAMKRGIHVGHHPLWLTDHFKRLIRAFGYHYHDAPGEAEAELAHLNKLGFIDAVITEDSDALVFGARTVIRTLGLVLCRPHVGQNSHIYTSSAISAHPLYLDEDGLLLFALLVGGDYDSGIYRCGSKTAHALARCGFGKRLRQILTDSAGDKINLHLSSWRQALRAELQTNASGLLQTRCPTLANSIAADFPNLDVVQLYIDPLTSWSSRFAGHPPDPSLWLAGEPVIRDITDICAALFGWQAALRDRFKAKLWPGVAVRMLNSV
ncbi:PIN domain-like protein, partial [Mycena crocata]